MDLLDLYVIPDLFSRYLAGWMVAPRESAQSAHNANDAEFRVRPAAWHNFTAVDLFLAADVRAEQQL